jgi:hypothetical protein
VTVRGELREIRVNGMVHALDFSLTDKLALSNQPAHRLGKYAGAFHISSRSDNGDYSSRRKTGIWACGHNGEHAPCR